MEDIYIASTWRRIFAFLIDQVFILFFYLPFAKTFLDVFFSDEEVMISLPKLLVLFLVPALYEFVFLMILQATPGKWLLNMKVVPSNNPYQELPVSSCILRPLVGRLTFFFSWAIYALAFFRYDRTHLADWVAETRLIQFIPRDSRPKIRWILGSFLIVCYVYEGLDYSTVILQSIDWSKKQVELRSLMEVSNMADIQFEGDEDL